MPVKNIIILIYCLLSFAYASSFFTPLVSTNLCTLHGICDLSAQRTVAGDNGIIYITGGGPDPRPSNLPPPVPQTFRLLQFNTTSNSVTLMSQGGDVPGGNAFHAAWYSYPNIYVFGGDGFSTQSKSFYSYNIITGNWMNLSQSVSNNFPATRVYSGFSTYEDKTYIFGGITTPFYGQPLALYNDLWVFDHNTLNFTYLGVPPSTLGLTPRTSAYVFAFKNKVYVYAGEAFVGGKLGCLEDMYFYNVHNGKWKVADQYDRPMKPLIHGAYWVQDNESFCVYSGDYCGGCSVDLVNGELRCYDRDSELWEVSEYDDKFKRSTATKLNNNVYLFGGFQPGLTFDCPNYECSTCTGFNQTYNNFVWKSV